MLRLMQTILFSGMLTFVSCCLASRIPTEILQLEQKAAKGDSSAFLELTELSKTNTDASKILGVMYFKGIGTKKDIAKGLVYFEQSARLGDREAAQFLVKFYSAKNSLYRDEEKAKNFQMLLQENSVGGAEKLPSSPETYSKVFQWRPFVEPSVKAKWHGSGFAINSNGHFVTNHHVTDGCKKIVVIYNEKKGYAEVVANSKELDLAVINVNEATPYYLEIRNKTPAIGDKVKAAGFPKGWFKFSEGVVSATQNNSVRFQFSASISSGSSGGPIVDQSASIVGVAQSGIAPGVDDSGSINGADFNFAVDAVYLNKFLASNGIQFHQSTRSKIFSESDVARVLQKTSAFITCY